MPAAVGEAITAALSDSCPTVGIGAGPATTGQVLVFHDMVGFSSTRLPPTNSTSSTSTARKEEAAADPDAPPKFCKQYAAVGGQVQAALRAYVDEVHSGAFPGEEYAPYAMAKGEEDQFRALLAASDCGAASDKDAAAADAAAAAISASSPGAMPAAATVGAAGASTRVVQPFASLVGDRDVGDLLGLCSAAEQKIY